MTAPSQAPSSHVPPHGPSPAPSSEATVAAPPHATALPHEIALPARLDYAACEPLAEALDSARGGAVRISARDVTQVGAMPVELLLRARMGWQAEGHGFELGETSAAFDAGIATLGLTRAEFETGPAAAAADAGGDA